MGQEKFSYDSIQDIESVKQYLLSLLEAFNNRRIVLKSENEELVLTMEELFRFSVRAKKKGRTNKLSIKMSWTREDDEQGDKVKSMTIAS